MNFPTEHEWLEGLDDQSMEDALLEEAGLDDQLRAEAEFFPLHKPDGSLVDGALEGEWL